MGKSATLLATVMSLAVPSMASAQRARIPVRLSYGWETACHHLASVPADSKVYEGLTEKNLELGFVYDQFWLVLPFWTSGGSFALYRAVEPTQKPDEFWVLKEQDAEKLAALIGIPEDRFTRPFFYRIPFGWLVVVGIILFVSLTSGPSPKTRFERLWGDRHFRAAVASLLGKEGQDLPDEFEAICLTEPPTEADARFDAEVRRLEGLGIGRRKAIRDLEFMMRYLLDNGKVVLVDPPSASDTAERIGEDSSPT